MLEQGSGLRGRGCSICMMGRKAMMTESECGWVVGMDQGGG